MGDGTDQKSEKRRVFECLSTLLFPALGFVVGLTLSQFLPDGGWWSLAARLLMVCYGLFGWAIGVCFIQQKRLYCGATETIKSNDWPTYAKRYGYGGAMVVAGLLLSTIGILGAANAPNWDIPRIFGFAVFFFSLPTTFAILVGEIGWEDPWWVFKMFAERIRK